MKDVQLTKEWIQEFAELIAKESYKLVKDAPKPKNENVDNELVSKVVGLYIEHAILHIFFREHKAGSPQMERFKAVHDDFLDIKIKLQDEIAQAFDRAWNKYTGKSPEYCCVINPFPIPWNKESC